MSEKLTPAQAKMLRKVVATNGGGVASWHLQVVTMNALYCKGLIQGKMSNPHYVVHTRDGLQWVRENPA